MAIVTISHEMGAGGPEIGSALGQRLGYRYVDQELISEAARRYGLLEDKLTHLDETKPSLFERFDAETRRYITVIQTALYESSWDGADSGSSAGSRMRSGCACWPRSSSGSSGS
jgi:cytidylate kinase